MKGVQCYELFGGIALKNHAFSLIKFHTVKVCCRAFYQQHKHSKWKTKKIVEIGKHLNDLEQFSKMNNLIISGFNGQYISYAQSV